MEYKIGDILIDLNFDKIFEIIDIFLDGRYLIKLKSSQFSFAYSNAYVNNLKNCRLAFRLEIILFG